MVLPLFGLGSLAGALGLAQHAGTKRANLPDSPMRAAVLVAVSADPGMIFSELRERLGCSAGTIQHHVNLLEKEGFLVSVHTGRLRRLFLADTPTTIRTEVDLLRSGRAWQLIRSVLDNPGIIQKDIAVGMAMSRKVLRSYLTRLAERGLLREVTAGRYRAYYPAEGLAALMQRMDLNSTLPESLEPPRPPVAPADAPLEPEVRPPLTRIR